MSKVTTIEPFTFYIKKPERTKRGQTRIVKGVKQYGKRNPILNTLTGKSGVYLILNKTGSKVLYVGSSVGNLKKVIARHFYKWEPYQFRRDRFNPGKVKIGVYLTKSYTPCEIRYLEDSIIKKTKPKYNQYGQRKFQYAAVRKSCKTYVSKKINNAKDENVPF